jgi:hypothetical protein
MSVLSKWPRPWRKYTGSYQKIEYDVLLKNGKIIPNCWPNAGKLNATDGSGRRYGQGIMFRRAENPKFAEIPPAFTSLQKFHHLL